MNSSSKFHPHQFVFGVIVAVAVCIRMINIGTVSLWYDEAVCYFQIQVIDLVIRFDAIIHPPLYQILLYLWTLVVGTSEFALRFPSVFFDTLTVCFMYFAGKKLFNTQVGLFAAGITALSPFRIFFAQQAKEHALAGFLYILSFYMLSIFITECKNAKIGTRKWFDLWVVHSLLWYGNAMSFLGVISHNVWFLCWRRRFAKQQTSWILVNAATVLPFLPMILLWSELSHSVIENSWVNPVTLKTFPDSFRFFTSGFYAEGLRMFCIGGICAITLILGMLRLVRKPILLSLLMITLILPPITLFFISFVSKSIYLERVINFITVPMYLLIALGMSNLRNRWLKTLASSLMVICLIVPLRDQLMNERMPFGNRTACSKMENKNAAETVKSNWQAGDVILHTNFQSQIPFMYYLPYPSYPGFHVMRSDETPDVYNKLYYSSYPEDRMLRLRERWNIEYMTIDQSLETHRRVWIVCSNYGLNDIPSELSVWVLDRAGKWGSEELNQSFKGLQLHLYVKKETPGFNS